MKMNLKYAKVSQLQRVKSHFGEVVHSINNVLVYFKNNFTLFQAISNNFTSRKNNHHWLRI